MLDTVSSRKAAGGGRLVFGTLRAATVTEAVDRLIEVFPQGEQARISSMVSTTLKMVVEQNLLKRIDQKGRCAALEIMICTNAISNLIREGKIDQIAPAIQTDKKLGSQRLDDAIIDLLNKEWISPEEAKATGVVGDGRQRSVRVGPEDRLDAFGGEGGADDAVREAAVRQGIGDDAGHAGAVERLQEVGVLNEIRRCRGDDVEGDVAAALAGACAGPLVGQFDRHGAIPGLLRPVAASRDPDPPVPIALCAEAEAHRYETQSE
jgi:hypothetical protein